MIETIHTPGHSPDSVCFIANEEAIFTGDTLFVSECGRTDLPGGSNEDMYNSLVKILRKMPDNLTVYPGHDYGPTKISEMGDEKRNNYTLKERTKVEFLKFMLEPWLGYHFEFYCNRGWKCTHLNCCTSNFVSF